MEVSQLLGHAELRIADLYGCAFAGNSSALTEDVHPCHLEVLRGLQHVAVVRVDLLEAVLLGACQVERVTGSDDNSARKIEDGFASLFQQLRSHTKPLPHSVLLIFFEVFQDRRHLSASYVAPSGVSREDRRKLQPCQFTRSQAVRAIRYFPDPIRQLTPLVIQQWLTEHMREHGARRRIELAHAVLRSSLAEAKRLQIVGINAAESVKVPKSKSRKIVPLTVEQSRALLVAAQRHRFSALFSVALASGLRLGEATGLSWDDVNLATGELQVRHQLQRVGKQLILQPLKTEKSRRTLMLPAVCLEQLRKHRQQQLKERLKAGRDWCGNNLVFTTYTRRGPGERVGAPLHPRCAASRESDTWVDRRA